MPKISTKLASALLAAAVLSGSGASAQGTFPTKPVKIVMPIPVGSALDVAVRLVGESMSADLGQQIVIENRPGGGGIIAAQTVAASPADGYTLLGGASSIFTILPAQKDKPSIDVNRDLTQVGMLLTAPMFLSVSPKLGVNSLADFVAKAKSQPQTIFIGTNGAGSLPHYTAVALAKRADIPVTVVPYNSGGTSEAIRDVMGGRVQAVVEGYGGVQGAVQSGDLKLIGVMSPDRDAQFKDLPAVAEQVPGFSSVGFMSLAAPAGTPPAVIERVNAALNSALKSPKVSQRMQELGMPVMPMSASQTTAFIESEQKIWWPIVRDITPN